jgi:hypothetical protein
MGKFLAARPRRRGSAPIPLATRRLRFELLEPRQLLATLVVNTAADTVTVGDTLSLRQAIELSNGTLAFSALSSQEQGQVSGDLSAANTIDFDIPGSGVPIIIPTASLPEITHPVTIDGTSQPVTARVALDGASAGASVDGLTISAGSSAVEGLIIGLFDGSGIRVMGAGGDVIAGCFLGTDLVSDTGIGNAGDGVLIDDSSDNTIGGTDPAARNIISGNAGNGIGLVGSGATGNVVEGNFVGTDVAGMQALANAGSGIALLQNAANNLIGGTTPAARNVVSGNTQDGVLFSGAGSSNQVQGNYLGTNADGSGLLSNTLDGVTIIGASGNVIGGPDAGAGNVISGSGDDGVNIFSSTDGTDTTANMVQGNWIGLDAAGTAALGNLVNGVLISNARNNLIGGSAAGAGNVVSGNGQDGIELAEAASGNSIEGNRIGTNPAGTQAQPNVQDGVFITGASSNTIGGTAPWRGQSHLRQHHGRRHPRQRPGFNEHVGEQPGSGQSRRHRCDGVAAHTGEHQRGSSSSECGE